MSLHLNRLTLSKDESKIYTENQLQERYGIIQDRIEWKTKARKTLKRKLTCSVERTKKILFGLIPILQWLPEYKPKQYLVGDIAAGVTVGIVHLPQGMAYALLASLPAVMGLYVSFFPVLIYVIFGTSRHVSVGTFAVISLMIAQVISNHVPPCVEGATDSAVAASVTATTVGSMANATGSSALAACEIANTQRKVEIAVALSLANGVLLIAMSVFRLGFITTYLSEHLVSGFTCGAAFHVLTSQVPKLLGIPISRHSGPMALIYTYIEVFKEVTDINWATFIVSLCCIVFLFAGKVFNARFHDRLLVPIPWELAVVVISTMASYFGHLQQNHALATVGNIPTGIKTTVPQTSDIGLVILEAIPIAIVSFAIEVSLCQMFAMKHSYEVDSNQELFALGFGNIFGSFFSCFPVAASLSRSVIWDEVGAYTQVTGVVSSILILVVLLWIGPLFESLPQAALAAIIVVNLKGMLRQFEKVKPLWSVSQLDALTWVITWLSVILLGVELGLAVAVGFELFTVILKTQIITGYMMSDVGRTGNFRRKTDYTTRRSNSNTNYVVFHFPGPLYFANKERFKVQILRAIGFDPLMKSSAKNQPPVDTKSGLRENTANSRRHYSATDNHSYEYSITSHDSHPYSEDTDSAIEASVVPATPNGSYASPARSSELSFTMAPQSPVRDATISHGMDCDERTLTHLVIDMSTCAFVDNDGAKTLKTLHIALLKLDVLLLLAACNDNVRDALTTICTDQRPPFFVSVKKAVEFVRGETSIELDELGNVSTENAETGI